MLGGFYFPLSVLYSKSRSKVNGREAGAGSRPGKESSREEGEEGKEGNELPKLRLIVL
jgi:hypothetical protein